MFYDSGQRKNHLEHRLNVHHVEVGHDRPVDHHDLVALDDACNYHDDDIFHDVDEDEC